MEMKPPLPPFTLETATEKVRLAENAWNTRDPQRVALAYTPDSQWRNRAEFPRGRDEIIAFLTRKWSRELDYRLIKELWAFRDNRIAVRFAYEWHDSDGQWFRSYGNENWEFDANGLMQKRFASINDLADHGKRAEVSLAAWCASRGPSRLERSWALVTAKWEQSHGSQICRTGVHARTSRPSRTRVAVDAPTRASSRVRTHHNVLGPQEAAFIGMRDSFYMATVSETGWPYIQHRGGPAGFLKVLDERTIGFADFRGNRQYISVGNLKSDDRVSLFLMDYANKARLKILGRARIVDASDEETLKRLALPAYRAQVERGMLISVEAFDWNCPQHITQRFTLAEVEAATEPLRRRIEELESALHQRGDGVA